MAYQPLEHRRSFLLTVREGMGRTTILGWESALIIQGFNCPRFRIRLCNY